MNLSCTALTRVTGAEGDRAMHLVAAEPFRAGQGGRQGRGEGRACGPNNATHGLKSFCC